MTRDARHKTNIICVEVDRVRSCYTKVFDPAVLEAMRRMQATLEELRRGQQKASSILSFDGKLLKPNRREVAG